MISFHDISSGMQYCRISGERLRQCNPLTIDCFHDESMEREVLVIGDDSRFTALRVSGPYVAHKNPVQKKVWKSINGPHSTRKA